LTTVDGGFRRIAIVNRGEPAMRLVNAVEEYEAAHRVGMTTIALYTDPDRRSMFVRRAREAYHLGPASFLDADGQRQVTYLDLDRLEEALVRTRADAAWVGWGFVAERPEFVELCDRLGVTFIGPPAAVMRRLGDKITSKQVAEAADVPVAPWSGGAVETLDGARTHAERLGYPLLIKATAGGGGRGIRRVDRADELEGAFASARAEAHNAFGDPGVFLETLVPRAKHIEVQILGDRAGTVWAVGVRDCSVQRRNQKLLEEAPSPSLTPEQHLEVRTAAARLGAAAGYVNAGTVEFLFDPATEQFSFMEVNARLQVEHPVTELTTGVDLVKLQLHVARGGLLDPEPPPTVGHAIEARLNAEDPDAGFAPSPGRVEMLRLPSGIGLRVDTGVEEGDDVAAEFDSMIAKVIAVGRDRDEALARLRRGLGDTAVVIAGGTSNKAFLQSLLGEPEVVDATADVAWVDRIVAAGGRSAPDHADVAIVAAAIDAHREQLAIERRQFRASAARGRPQVDTTVGRRVGLRYRGDPFPAEVFRLAPDAYRVLVGGRSVTVHRTDLGHRTSRLTILGKSYRVLSSAHGVTHFVEVDGHPHRIAHDEGGVVRARAPAVVTSIAVAPGDEVQPGDRLAVIEAMKMETVVEADFAGRVEEVFVQANAQVAAGAPLLVVRPLDGDDQVEHTDRVTFERIAARGEFAHGECRHYLEAARQALLGFDVDPGLLATMSNPGATPCPETLDRSAVCAVEEELLGIFADVISLFRREPAQDEDLDELTRRATEEYLFDYLLHTETRGEGLPERFLRQLERTLAHFGVDGLEPTTGLDVALHRIVLSQKRMANMIPIVLEILEDRLVSAGTGGDDDLRELLDRLVVETHRRHPAVRDLAEELRYRVFDEPFLSDVRNRVRAAAVHELDALATDPPPVERAAHIEALVRCPQPLKTLLSYRFASAPPSLQGAMLEVMTRRYYRIRGLEQVHVVDCDGTACVTGEYDYEGRRIHVVSTHVDADELEQGAARLVPLIESFDPDHDVVVDVYGWRHEPGEEGDRLADHLAATLSRALGPLALRRIVVAMSQPGVGTGMSGVLHHTFRADGAGGYREDLLYRDLHPMMGKRLELWRLGEFDVRRVPSTEDVYVFHGRARDNRRDERLFALAEVRDLTPLLDDAGNLVRLPEAERVVHEVFGAIRRFQARLPAAKRLQANRIILYVWPALDLPLGDVRDLVDRLTPDAEGLGIQKVEVVARLTGGQPGAGDGDGGGSQWMQLEAINPGGESAQVRIRPVAHEPIRPFQPYEQNVVRLRQRGLHAPYEVARILTPPATTDGIAAGEFTEYDLDDADQRQLVPVDRPPGENSSNIVVGVVTNRTARYPEGMMRVALIGDPSRGMGNLAEPECARIDAALDLAEELHVPVEWFAVSAGALIAMDSGTENMDWIARVLRRIIEFTQAGGELNVIVTGINVGAQPYWNAEATMLMHTSGILIMMPESAMVLTGKDALDFSGGVSAEDNIGIGGYERIMGPNGQAQYFVRDLPDACRHLLQHYEYTYVAPGERHGRPAATSDPVDRDVRRAPHGGHFATVAEVFDEATNPGRKQPFEIRKVMAAVVDQDHPTMERWFGMRDAEIPVVWDAFLGGRPVALIGFESKALPRPGFVPADGPDQWTSGTLFPQGSRKVARAINAASGNRPLVVLANLSGFDGSPESMRERQLEFGAEIGRAVVNFDGPIVFCVVGRYHGGAFVVFSGALNDHFEVAAIEGSKASVIGGAPAAAVVFAREVRARVDRDPRVVALEDRLAEAAGADRARLRAELEALRDEVHAEHLGAVAEEFDRVHDIRRAQRVGSVDRIIPAAELRPYLIDAVERGLAGGLARGAVE
jgi:acetyl/propionyl-CoA carboxylase alpha subunit/acetyl-CoA carboxylase carboxyltransferase component